MTYVAGFEHDIFLSYSHVDNLKAPSKQRGWIQQFHEDLEIKLAQRFGRIGAVTVWWDDRGVSGNQIFDATIQAALEKSATFLAITSIGYLASPYCQREVSEFHRKATLEPFGLAIGDRSRIINVLLYNIPHEQWPESYGGTTGIPFHAAKRPEELSQPYNPNEKPFEERLYHLIEDIHALLHAFKASAGVMSTEGTKARVPAASAPRVASPQSVSTDRVPPTDDGLFRIYVADVPDTLRTEQRQVIESLTKEGVRVDSGIPPPYEAAPHERRLLETLQGVNASVHLLDVVSGRPIDGMPDSTYVQFQLERALDHRSSTIVWCDADAAAPPGFASIRGPRSRVVADVLDRVRELVRDRRDTAATHTVLLDFHPKDYEHAVRVHEFLEKHGLTTLTGPDADDPRHNIELFEQRLKQAGTMVIPLGRVSETWVRERVNAALQLIAATDCPTRKILVYVVPPRVSPHHAGPSLGVAVRWVDTVTAAEQHVDVMSELLREIGVA